MDRVTFEYLLNTRVFKIWDLFNFLNVSYNKKFWKFILVYF